MTINYHGTSDFTAEARHLITGVENSKPSVHDDGVHVPTIGYGYAMVIKKNGRWEVKDKLEDDLDAVGLSLDPESLDKLDEIAAAKNRGDDAAAEALIAGHDFGITVTETQANDLFDLELARALDSVEKQFIKWRPEEGEALYDNMAGSKELVALASMAYNAPTLIGKGLTEALADGDRAEAWFEIRYNSNKLARLEINDLYKKPGEQKAIKKNVDDGIAKRRYIESSEFGLYDTVAEDATLEESLSIYQMYTEHQDYILEYEKRYETQVGAARAEPSAAGLEIPTLEEAFQLAKDQLLTEYGRDGIDIDYRDIQVADEEGGSLEGHRRDNWTLSDTAPEVNDLLIGQGGTDTLSGGGGSDILVGGKGDDILKGGAGSDVYVYESGDGKDFITDSEGSNRLYVGEQQLTGSDTGYVFSGPSTQTWTVNGGEYVYEYHSVLDTLTISGSAVGDVDDRIVVNGIGSVEEANERFGIDLKNELEVALTLENTNPFAVEGFTASEVNADIGENGGQGLTIALNQSLQAGDTVTLYLDSGNPDEMSVCLGDDTISFADGPVTLTAEEGQHLFSVALLHEGELSADASASFHVVVESTDDQGNSVSAESNLFTMDIADLGGNFSEVMPGEVYSSGDGPNDENDEIGARLVPDPNDPSGTSVTYSGVDGRDQLFSTLGGDDIVVLNTVGNTVVDLGDGDDELWSGESVGDMIIQGGNGRDHAVGGLYGVGSNLMEGGDGADMLGGGENDDYIFGDFQGDAQTLIEQGATQQGTGLQGDWLDGAGGDDQLFSGAGNDFLNGGDGDDLIVSGGGDDFIYGDGKSWAAFPDTYTHDGVPYDWRNWSYSEQVDENGVSIAYNYQFEEVILWDPGTGNDVIHAGAGDDIAYGQDGDDLLYLEDGADVGWGGAGADILLGGAGDDVLSGDNGTSVLAEDQHGDDFLDGGDGDDRVIGNGGNDILYGGAGDDVLQGENGDEQEGGDDYLNGEDGNDWLFGSRGSDTLEGGAGNDVLVGGAQADVLRGGDGADQLFGDSSDLPEAEHGEDILDGGAGDDILVGGGGADILFGGSGNDQMWGEQGANYLDGGEGDDILVGGDDADMLFGGADRDVIFGGDGNDVIDGGEGNDDLQGDAGDDLLIGGGGNDVYRYGLGQGTDHISDSNGTDWLVFSDATTGDIKQLSLGSLAIVFKDGSEVHLDDFDPNDPYAGSIEYFQFADGTVMTQQQLVETFGFQVEGTPDEDTLSGTASSDTIDAKESDDSVTALGGDDFIDLGAGNDWADAGSGDDMVNGGAGDDIVDGGDGDDILDGGIGADILYGGAGADSLRGGDGDDWLAGGGGVDLLEGGSGFDDYQFGAGDGHDTVRDSDGSGRVQLSGLGEEDVAFRRDGDDLVIDVTATGDRLTVEAWFASTGWSVGLGDGTVLDGAAVEERLQRNQAPLAQDDSAHLGESTASPVTVNVLANDTDPEGSPLRVTNPGTYDGEYGTLILQADGTAIYALDTGSAEVEGMMADQTYTDSFSYVVTDDDPAGAQTGTGTVHFNITGENDAPVAAVEGTVAVEDTVPVVTGNVLSNDTDADIGDVMQVVIPGTYQGEYGTLTLAADGAYTYALNNEAAQSLGREQVVSESFAYTVTDLAGATDTATLTVSTQGRNDAPVVVTPLEDQTATPNRSFSWQIPESSFADVDQNDTLHYSASLADGSALPDWLSFDAATGTLSGRVPRDADGYLDIQVTATDGTGGVAREDDLSTSDVFRLTFDATQGGGGGGSTGNAGVGNGTDAPPPGHDYNFNDAGGAEPGSPGAQGGNGYQPNGSEPLAEQAGLDSPKQTSSSSTVRAEPDRAAGNDSDAEYLSADEEALAEWFDAGPEQTPRFQTVAADEAATLEHGRSDGVFDTWKQVDSRLRTHLATGSKGAGSQESDAASGVAEGAAFLGSTTVGSADPLSVVGAGKRLDVFQGLKDGLQKAS